ncbi:sigma factor [Pseudorhodoplanes sp.]|uniref:sigma factor n=1 Tax=Pseudorhodoplanes sp. TaxID=1934341 RepID=UPI00391BB530
MRTANASAAQAAPASDRCFDQPSLRTMMSAAAYHARRVARTMRLSNVEREDVEQDILLVMLERRRFFDPARGAWSAFADRVARQAAQGVANKIGAEFRMWGASLDQSAGSNRTTTLGDLSETQQWVGSDDEQELQLPLVLADFIAGLPEELALVARLSLFEDGDLPAAQRRSGLSTSEFYRRLREIRYRMFTLEIVDRRSILRPPGSDQRSQSVLRGRE